MPNENAPSAPATNQEDESEHELQQKSKEVARATEEILASAVAGLKMMGPGSTTAASGDTDESKLDKSKLETKVDLPSDSSKYINHNSQNLLEKVDL